MNRQILFRGLTASNEWVEGFYVHDVMLGHRILNTLSNYIKVKPESIGQKIDGTDCDNKNLFEGDVVVVMDRGSKLGLIKWNEATNSFIVLVEGDKCMIKSKDLCRLRKVGSIHTGPELLQP